MYKVYLVEDESAVRNAIRERIAWEDAGFSFIGEAPDGEVALQEIFELKPDLVITDIRMPFMDGLTLSSRLKELFPRIRIVILTGHDDFEYAQQAIACGVSDYLLKPLSAEKLMETLNKIFCQMDEERSLMLQVEELENFKKEEFLRAMCEGAAVSVERMREAEQYGLKSEDCSVLVLIIKPAYPKIERRGSEPSIKNRVQKYLKWLTAEDPDYFYFEYLPGYSAIIIRNKDRDLLDEKALLFASTVQEQFNSTFQLPTAIAIGRSVSSLEKVSESCEEAIELLRNDLYYNKVLFKEREDIRYAHIAERCKEFIAEHHVDPELSLPMAAFELSISPGRLSTLFHQETGERFISYLNRYRLEKSQVLLETTDLPIASVAEECGYNQAHYFSSLFKRVYGISPLVFRQQKRLP